MPPAANSIRYDVAPKPANYAFARMYSSMARAAFLPAPMASMTVAAPVDDIPARVHARQTRREGLRIGHNVAPTY